MVKIKEDLTGKVFGSLTVISRAPDRPPLTVSRNTRTKACWNCQCSCGEKMIFTRKQVLEPRHHTCWHNKPNPKPSIRIGMEFGNLKVTAPAADHITPSGIHKKQWECECTCGKKIIAQQVRLKLGEVTHCGCQRRNSPNKDKPITYDLSGDYGIGYTAKGEMFLFDLEDYGKLKDYRWYYNHRGYLQASAKGGNGKIKAVYLHKLVMGEPPEGKVINLIRHPEEPGSLKIDYRKENLRLVTRAESCWSKGKRSDNESGHTGVHFSKRHNCWIARVKKNGKTESKQFPPDKFEEACAWRDAMALQLFGEHAYIANNAPTSAYQEDVSPSVDKQSEPNI